MKKLANWREVVLISFPNGSGDGYAPSGLSVDKANHVFGTERAGGTYNVGAVFGMKHLPTGWQEGALYSFNNNGTDGIGPRSGVVVDGAEHLYGTTPDGGHGRGTVFELTFTKSGWKEKVIYNFEGGEDGANPYAGLVRDSAGNLYGTTNSGGTNNQGTLFQLSPSAQGWTKTVIYNFSFAPSEEALSFDKLGNLYAEESGFGTILKLSHSGSGWTAALFFQFNGSDGQNPNGGLIFDQAGNLYGTTYSGGGVFGAGVVFEITP